MSQDETTTNSDSTRVGDFVRRRGDHGRDIETSGEDGVMLGYSVSCSAIYRTLYVMPRHPSTPRGVVRRQRTYKAVNSNYWFKLAADQVATVPDAEASNISKKLPGKASLYDLLFAVQYERPTEIKQTCQIKKTVMMDLDQACPFTPVSLRRPWFRQQHIHRVTPRRL